MKKIIYSIITAITCIAGYAQVNTNLILMAQPPAQLSEWGNRREVLTLIVSSPGIIIDQFKIKAEIKTVDGTVIANTDLAKAPSFSSNPTGTTLLFANDVIPLEFMMFTGKYKTALQRTGKLPADNYTLCLQPVRPVDYTALGEVQCKSFYLASTQLPILMKPYNEEILNQKTAQTAITFRWTPVIPRQPSPVTYRLQVFEVLQTQSPMQALRSNQPLLDKEIIGATQYIWQPQLSFINSDSAKLKFIWVIQSLDKAGNPIAQTDGNGEGRSEPIIFYVGKAKSN
ncbi:MAG: hypothetical protein KF741_02380 [Ferruginibacter sp.]|nr:hypothetical protein [Bacteroidota bacterium]MBX2918067.1 hypothetical protein [Ferruginibacter sp.]MCC7379012.1 hypothetical protein [Chitinophagaceae bacterium]